MPDINLIKNSQKELKNSINFLSQKMKEITNEIVGNLETLYKINEDIIIKLSESQNRNYQILKNGNEINFYNKKIIDDINNIAKNNKLSQIIEIYNQMKDTNNMETKKDEEKSNSQCIAPISKDCVIKVYNNMIKYVCGILYKNYNKKYIVDGTGFFAKIPYNSRKLHVLITDSENLGTYKIKRASEIQILYNKDKIINIKLDDTRKRYVNEKLKITIIEIKKEDGIKFFYDLDGYLSRFLFDDKKNILHLSNKYQNESIYSINYDKEKRSFVSHGVINNFNEKEIKTNLYTEKLEYGGPIVLSNNNNLIGINTKSPIPR